MPVRNLGVFCPTQADATSFYRGMGPLGALRRSYKSDFLSLAFLSECHWASIKMLDYAFMQRPYTDSHLMIAKLIKHQRIPLWLDYDDYLFDLPTDNPCFNGYSDPKVKKNMETLLGLADVVSVSTTRLAELLYGYTDKLIVIRNAFDDWMLPLAPENPAPKKVILWRGSKTHDGDLDEMSNAAITLSAKYPDWTWLFLGSKPWFTKLMPKKNTIVIEEALDIYEYHQMLAEMQPALMTVPLAHSDFNRAKSDCAFIEGTFAGAAVIAPDFQEEFSPFHCIKYSSGTNPTKADQDLTMTLEATLNMDLTQLLAMQQAAWQYIKTKRLLSHANKQREAILDHLRELRA